MLFNYFFNHIIFGSIWRALYLLATCVAYQIARWGFPNRFAPPLRPWGDFKKSPKPHQTSYAFGDTRRGQKGFTQRPLQSLRAKVWVLHSVKVVF